MSQPTHESPAAGPVAAASGTSPASIELYSASAVDLGEHIGAEDVLLPDEWESMLEDWWSAAGQAPLLRGILETDYDIPSFFLGHAKLLDQFKAFLRQDPDLMAQVQPTLLAAPPGALADALLTHHAAEQLARPFLSAIRQFIEARYGKEVAAFRRARGLADLQNPQAWYPAARRLRRLWHLHLGPTNSGKTHAATQKLLAAGKGLYMGPLRLLAWEMFERMRTAGLHCALLTGQERVGPEDATHVACTVEAAPLSLAVDVAVVDEVQLVADLARGAAWTRALLGVQAKELHLCGADDPPGLPDTLRRLALDCGDVVSEEARRRRLVPLAVEDRPLGSLAAAQAGDCIICFTRHDIMLTKAELERLGQPTSMIYGSLPPRIRREQAALFNDAASGRNVLVATDAVGMGLNLDIRRVVFRTLRKFDGETTRQLHAAEIRQIAGRAGRFGGRYASLGLVTCFAPKDQEAVREALAGEESVGPLGAKGSTPKAAIFPLATQIEAFGRAMEADAGRLLPFADLVERFLCLSAVSPIYSVARADNVLAVARALAEVRMPPGEKLVFCQAPVAAGESTAMMSLHDFARRFAEDGHVPFPEVALADPPSAVTPRYIFMLEELHKVCDLYHWLAYRFSQAFPDVCAAEEARQRVAHRLGEALRQPLEIRVEEDEEERFQASGHGFSEEDFFLDDLFLD